MHQCYLDTTALLSVPRRYHYSTPASPREISINFLFFASSSFPNFPVAQLLSFFPVSVCCCEAGKGVNTAPGKAQGLTLCQNRCAFGQEV
ncbi:hypothetical protein CgunFtcFv8_000970 [Champsocephalus gunnari]|uniref:Uncharacterized protein n=1 Tax=Champsocephalus gunnari TaxID=52237 RepID=A0AAN8DKT1_CHAGU|nr:hypothetical protein CgunFtcFv8_000970 [Champsocephalus gunnari]